MSIPPLLEETSGGAVGTGSDQSRDATLEPDTDRLASLSTEDQKRKLAVYPASAGFELVDELDYLAARSIETNIFFNPRFLHRPCRGWKTAKSGLP